MKTKLTHRFAAKVAAIFLFTAAVLFVFACVGGMVVYQNWEIVMDDPWLSQVMPLRNVQAALPWLGILGALIAIALFIFLMCAAGRREGKEEPVRSGLDRVPFDLLLVIAIFLLYCMANIVDSAGWGGNIGHIILIAGIMTAISTLLLLVLSMSVATRIKTKSFWKTNVIAYVLRALWRGVRFIGRGLRTVYYYLPVLWKLIVSYVVFGFVCMVLFGIGITRSGFALFLFFVVVLVALGAICVVGLQLQKIKKGGEALAQGEMEARIDTTKLVWEIKKHAENLNSIGLGISRAVEARMKSERMKTDLITNVSHDLKTPLTSIVNYVELLKKEELHNENATEYIAVLDRQAQRLKKLTEDILEASKASSGAINVELTPTDAAELVHQGIAEYAEKLSLAGLTPIVQVAEDLPQVLADGRLFWRVMDNLLNNACKYSLSGTRLYVDAATFGDAVRITIKNISKEAIGVPVDELLERFSRGDASRTAEGSGLGLSIAKSLMDLQRGELRLAADGDLFKAEVLFLAV